MYFLYKDVENNNSENDVNVSTLTLVVAPTLFDAGLDSLLVFSTIFFEELRGHRVGWRVRVGVAQQRLNRRQNGGNVIGGAPSETRLNLSKIDFLRLNILRCGTDIVYIDTYKVSELRRSIFNCYWSFKHLYHKQMLIYFMVVYVHMNYLKISKIKNYGQVT